MSTKNINSIPKGMYCYKHTKELKSGELRIIGVCSYWEIRQDKPYQENGYCSFLEEGDWETDGPLRLLWDMVKECKTNM